jgi:protein gp37
MEKFPNVWLGVSVENQAAADARIPILLRTPAAIRFISAEPLLGPLDITSIPWTVRGYLEEPHGDTLDWVICGGESGPHARPMHPDWARGLRDQCQAAGIPFFFKQWGEWCPGENVESARKFETVQMINDEFLPCSDDWVTEADSDEPILYRVGKKAAGRSLGGREWDEFPQSAMSNGSVKQKA